MSLLVVVALVGAAPAEGYWRTSGTGAGSATVATMPSGNQPSGSVSGQSVTVTWAQSTFNGGALTSVTGGGYRVARYPQGSSIAATIGSACATTISATSCAEAGVPYGAWQYSTTPVLGGSFTGPESTKSTAVTVATSAPSVTATATNPGAGQSTGGVLLTWAAAPGATGYNVYRRSSGGSFVYTSPVNGGTPLGAVTSYTDTSAALTGGTTYDYVVRAVAGTPTVESADSNAPSATVIARPAAPAGAVNAVAGVAGRIDVSWSAVSGAVGYNIYRRTSAGSFDFTGPPLNGGTPAAGPTYADTTTSNGTSYVYVVRAVILGAGSAQVESVSSSESNAAIADNAAPPVPSAVSVSSGGTVASGLTCIPAIADGTRYISNVSGLTSVGVSATIAAAETGESVVFTATTPGSTAVTATVAASGTSASTTLNLSSLVQGTVTVTAQTKDLAGNLSATKASTNVVIKDTTAPSPPSATYNLGIFTLGVLVTPYSMSGSGECGASIRARETVGPSVGTLFPPGGPRQIVSGTSTGTYSFTVDGALLVTYRYDVTATDLAGNTSTATNAGN